MKKKFLLILMTFLLIRSFTTLQIFADESENPLFVDLTNSISQDETNSLNEKLSSVSEKQECAVVICITDDFGEKTATEYADDYFDTNGYGYGSDNSGILLVINTESHDWAISTTGYGIKAFTDAGQSYIMDQITPELGDGSYVAAFSEFAELCDDYLTQAHTDEAYDNSNMPSKEKDFNLARDISVGILIGIIIAFLIVHSNKSALKTVRREPEAKNYMRDGSLNISKSREILIHTDVEKIKIKNEDSGSSTHTSSSGETHGGSSGKF